MEINVLVDIFDYCALHPRPSMLGKAAVPPQLQYLHAGYVMQPPSFATHHRLHLLRLMNRYMRPDVIWRRVRDYLLTHLDEICYWPGYVKPELYPNGCVDPKRVLADRKTFFSAMAAAGRGDLFDVLKICELVTSLKARIVPQGIGYEIICFPYWRWVQVDGVQLVPTTWRPERSSCNIEHMRRELTVEILGRQDNTEIGVMDAARMTGLSPRMIRAACQTTPSSSGTVAGLKVLRKSGREYRFNRYQVMDWMWRNHTHTWTIEQSSPETRCQNNNPGNG